VHCMDVSSHTSGCAFANEAADYDSIHAPPRCIKSLDKKLCCYRIEVRGRKAMAPALTLSVKRRSRKTSSNFLTEVRSS
jgi:hypothetical protein